jgi:hypothetical protein
MVRTFCDTGVAAAHLSRADEFVTTEKPSKAIHRSSLVKVVYLFR